MSDTPVQGLTDADTSILLALDEQLEKREPCMYGRMHSGDTPAADYRMTVTGMWCSHLSNPALLCMDCVVHVKTMEADSHSNWKCGRCGASWPHKYSTLTFTRLRP